MKRKSLILVIVGSFFGLLTLLYTNMSRPLIQTHLDLYMAATGNDANDGLTPKTPVKTLKRAHALTAARLKSNPTDIEIHIAPGTYFHQNITWTAVHPDYYVIIGAQKPGNRPVFDGRIDANQTLGDLRSFFVLSSQGRLSNLTLQNIVVRNYAEAVTFSGNRENFESGFNGNNKILFSVFDRIGSQYHKDQNAPAYAAVRFVNSRFNQVKGNVFTNIRNKTRPELLHSLYVANYSSHNQIEGNAFRNQGGDPVRLRDFSNFNNIFKNEFDHSGDFGYSEWYCEKASSSACTKTLPECPSWGNVFKENILKGVGPFKLYVNPVFDPKSSACKTAAPAEASNRRLRTALNTTGGKVHVVTYLNNKPNYGLCPSAESCISSSGACYGNGKGSTHYICDAKSWHSCSSDADVGKVKAGVQCRKSGTGYLWAY